MTSVSNVFLGDMFQIFSSTVSNGQVFFYFSDFRGSITSRHADTPDIVHSSVLRSKSESQSDYSFYDDRTKDVAKILNKNLVDFPSCKQKQRMALSAVKVLSNLQRRLDGPKSPVSMLLTNVIQYGDRSSNSIEKVKKDTKKKFHKVWFFFLFRSFYASLSKKMNLSAISTYCVWEEICLYEWLENPMKSL